MSKSEGKIALSRKSGWVLLHQVSITVMLTMNDFVLGDGHPFAWDSTSGWKADSFVLAVPERVFFSTSITARIVSSSHENSLEMLASPNDICL
jgi:hypothetical protein